MICMLYSLVILDMCLAIIFDPTSANTNEPTVFGRVGLVIIILTSYISAGWILVQKGRNLFWIILMGLYSHLWLSNKRDKIIQSEGER